jgi:hypothetical protein
VNPFTVRLKFHGDLSFFLKSKNAIVERQFREKTSIKDVIESCGVPHPEVDLILINRQPVDFAYVVERDTDVDVYPVNMRILLPENRLQASHIEKFIADGHLGKLVRDLRLLGFDVVYDPSAEDRQSRPAHSRSPPAHARNCATWLLFAVAKTAGANDRSVAPF